MAKGLDYSSGRPSGRAVRQAGYTFVVRYVGTAGRDKNLTRAEAADLLRNNVAIALVYEDSTGTALQGRARGIADARAALADARTLGIPVRCLYLAVDFDAQPSQFGAIDAYFRGAATVLGHSRTGAYGGYPIIKYLLDKKIIGYAWQTAAWSDGRTDSRIDLYQRIGGVDVGGVTCDVDLNHDDDFGQYPWEDDLPSIDEMRDLIDQRLSFFLTALGSGAGNSVTSDPKILGLRKAVDALRLQVAASDAKIAALVEFIQAGQSGGTPAPEGLQAMLDLAAARAVGSTTAEPETPIEDVAPVAPEPAD